MTRDKSKEKKKNIDKEEKWRSEKENLIGDERDLKNTHHKEEDRRNTFHALQNENEKDDGNSQIR
jgi:hypothetical protein